MRMRRQQRVRRRHSNGSSSDLSQQESAGGDGIDDADTSISSSIGFVRYGGDKNSKLSGESQGTFVDHGSGVAVDCTRDIFACFNQPIDKRYENVPVTRDSDGSFIFAHEINAVNCDTGIDRDSLKYYSKPVRIVIDRNQSCRADSLIHTSTAELIIGHGADGCVSSRTPKGSPTEEISETSGFDRRPMRVNMACEDLVNLDDSMKMKCDKNALAMVDERHSMPTLFVGNRFNCSSMTEVFIPSYKDKRDVKHLIDASAVSSAPAPDDLARNSLRSATTTTTTHSSSFDIPALVPAPDQLSTELLYNSVAEPTGSSTAIVNDADGSYLIKPPSMFDGSRSLSKELSPFDKHTLNADKTNVGRRTCSQPKDKRCVSYHYLNFQGGDATIDLLPPASNDNRKSTPTNARKCGCCAMSPCHSPRSSDSGMAGSCTISSPDAPILSTENEYEQFDEDFQQANQVQRVNTGLKHSQSTHNFGRFNELSLVDGASAENNHDSGQYGHCNYEPENSGGGETSACDSAVKNMFELSMSRDTVKRQSRCHSAERTTEHPTKPQSPKRQPVFRTGLYAHWWKKEVLPADMLRDIFQMRDTRQRPQPNQLTNAGQTNRSNSTRGSGKPQNKTRFFFVFSLLLLYFLNFPCCYVAPCR